jgi:glycosyltransferase involved in cell wall biosynthesis
MPRHLRIGINALYLIPGGVGGTEIYLRSLLQALASIDQRNEYFVYVNAETAGEPVSISSGASPRFHIVHCNVRAKIRPYRIVWEQTLLPLRFRRDGIDVVLNPGFTAPILSGRPLVTVFHDLQHKRHPEFFRWFDLPFWNLLLGLSVARSRSVIADSAATARDLERYYPRAGSKAVVIHLGVDPEFFRIGDRRRAASASGDKYILIVSTLHPHKNIGRALEAFATFRASHPEFRLVIAGLKGFASEQLESRRRELGLEESVRFTGWIPRSELYDLFEGATASIAPSQFEGFGIPVIEALAAGIPMACSAIQPFDEIAGSAAARFDPVSVPEIAAALELIACDVDFRCRAQTAGPEQVRRFDWSETARRTLEELERAALDAASPY